MEFLEAIKKRLPDYAKDIRFNLDSTVARSSLHASDAVGVALAAAFASGNHYLVTALRHSQLLEPGEAQIALSAAALMGMNNSWYPFLEMAHDAQLRALPSQLRMSAHAEFTGPEKLKYEMCALAASIVGGCDFCVNSHFELLKRGGLDLNQLRDIGRIASVINATAKVFSAEGVH